MLRAWTNNNFNKEFCGLNRTISSWWGRKRTPELIASQNSSCSNHKSISTKHCSSLLWNSLLKRVKNRLSRSTPRRKQVTNPKSKNRSAQQQPRCQPAQQTQPWTKLKRSKLSRRRRSRRKRRRARACSSQAPSTTSSRSSPWPSSSDTNSNRSTWRSSCNSLTLWRARSKRS